MFNKCPGQDRRKASVENIVCPSCGYIAEIFSDEIKVKCSRCNNFISRVRLPYCVDWCRAARDCIGKERWEQLRGGVNDVLLPM